MTLNFLNKINVFEKSNYHFVMSCIVISKFERGEPFQTSLISPFRYIIRREQKSPDIVRRKRNENHGATEAKAFLYYVHRTNCSSSFKIADAENGTQRKLQLTDNWLSGSDSGIKYSGRSARSSG